MPPCFIIHSYALHSSPPSQPLLPKPQEQSTSTCWDRTCREPVWKDKSKIDTITHQSQALKHEFHQVLLSSENKLSLEHTTSNNWLGTQQFIIHYTFSHQLFTQSLAEAVRSWGTKFEIGPWWLFVKPATDMHCVNNPLISWDSYWSKARDKIKGECERVKGSGHFSGVPLAPITNLWRFGLGFLATQAKGMFLSLMEVGHDLHSLWLFTHCHVCLMWGDVAQTTAVWSSPLHLWGGLLFMYRGAVPKLNEEQVISIKQHHMQICA